MRNDMSLWCPKAEWPICTGLDPATILVETCFDKKLRRPIGEAWLPGELVKSRREEEALGGVG